jgi:hypothetical protein
LPTVALIANQHRNVSQLVTVRPVVELGLLMLGAITVALYGGMIRRVFRR